MGRKKKDEIDFSKMKKVKYKNRHVINKPYLYLNYKGRVLFGILIVLLLCIFSYIFINKSFAVYQKERVEYSENGNINYSITLKENDFYTSNTLEGGRGYISSLIDKIETTFKYNTFFSDKVILNYKYDIKGILYVYSEDGKILLDEEYDLVEEKEEEDFSNKFSILQELTIDYDKYNNIAKDYINTYAPNATSEFKVIMNIEYDGGYSRFYNSLLHHKTKLEMYIPLIKNNITIGINDKYLDNEGEYSEETLKKGVDNIYSYLGSIFLILAVVYAIYVITFIYQAQPKKNKYSKLRDSYLIEYDRLIVNTKTLPRFNDYNVIDCYDFNELLDAEEVLELPINYYEIVKDQKCVFYIVNGKDVYKYVLKDCDLEY